ncbi:MAG: hypothetical protein ACWA5K_00430, partial [bacterium]
MKKGVLTGRKPVTILSVLLAITFVALLFNVIYIFQKSSSDQAALQSAADLRTSSYQLVSLSR